MTASPQLRADAVTVTYGATEALRPFSRTVTAGDLVIVLGPNGAGKTSLLKALAGLIQPNSGRVYFGDRDVTLMPAFRRVKLGISLVPEGRGRLTGLSVLDNLELGLQASSDTGAQRRQAHDSEFERVFDLFPILRQRLKQDCSTLSDGEMQMLAIARALLAKPVCLLLDEPSLGLAPLAVAGVYDALARLNAAGLTMVLVEQKAVPLPNVREQTIVLRGGRVVFTSHRRPTSDELAELYLGESAA